MAPVSVKVTIKTVTLLFGCCFGFLCLPPFSIPIENGERGKERCISLDYFLLIRSKSKLPGQDSSPTRGQRTQESNRSSKAANAIEGPAAAGVGWGGGGGWASSSRGPAAAGMGG